MISTTDRRYALELVDEAHAYGARLHMACRILGITERTYHRWKKMLSEAGKLNDLRPCAERPTPANKLSPKEEQAILEQVSAPEFADSSPKQIVPQLADRGVYIASESTFYRTLHKHSMCHHRRSGKVHTHREIPTHLASDPNQVWMWDITYLPGDIKGSYYYLYLISDLFSRFIVGWEIWPEQTAEHASTLIRKTTLAWHIKSDVLVLHSDNGSPMKGATMLATMSLLALCRRSAGRESATITPLLKVCSTHLRVGQASRKMALKALKRLECGHLSSSAGTITSTTAA